MIKDVGMNQVKVVDRYTSDIATEMLRVCDDIFTAESISNKTDPELKRVAVAGIKRILSGATDIITNTFSYDSSTVRARTQVFYAGRDNMNNHFFDLRSNRYLFLNCCCTTSK